MAAAPATTIRCGRRQDDLAIAGAADRRRHPGLDRGVGERRDDDRDGGDQNRAAARVLRHRQADGIDVGQARQRRHDVESARQIQIADDLDDQQNDRKEQPELRRLRQREGRADRDLSRLAAGGVGAPPPQQDAGAREARQPHRRHRHREIAQQRGIDRERDHHHAEEHHRPGDQGSDRQHLRRLRAVALLALAREGERRRGRGNQAAGQAGDDGAAPRAKPAGRHVSDHRQAGDHDHQQPELAGIERVPRIDGLVRQQRQDDETGDQQPEAGEQVIPADLVDQAMQRLLVGQQRGDDDRKAHRQRGVIQRRQAGQQRHRDRRHFGDESDRPFPLLRVHQEAGHHGDPRHDHDDQQRPDALELRRQEAADRADHRHQHEGADAADGGLGLAPLLTLDADQRADQDRDGEILDGGKIEIDGHVRGAPCGESGAALWLPPSSTAAAARTRIVPIVSRAPKG